MLDGWPVWVSKYADILDTDVLHIAFTGVSWRNGHLVLGLFFVASMLPFLDLEGALPNRTRACSIGSSSFSQWLHSSYTIRKVIQQLL